MRPILIFLIVFCSLFLSAQTPAEIINSVFDAQKKLETVSYTIQKIDTFTSGTVWNMTGSVKVIVDPADKEFGFLFWGKRDGIENEVFYDGKMTYDLNTEKKTFRNIRQRENFYHVLGAPGGQMIFPDLVRLDTSKATGFELSESNDSYLLRLTYPDNDEHNLNNKFKEIVIDKKTMLPIAMRDHLVVLGKKQSRNFLIKDLKLNETSFAFNPEEKGFLEAYQQEVPEANKALLALIGKTLPPFSLPTFNNTFVSSEDFKGKVVLLDFWEVWCGPCVASMPKVQELHNKYKNKDLLVYGIINETDQLEPSKLLVEKKKILFPMLIGNNKIKEDFHLDAVPLYVVIDKEGKISFVHEGYSDEIEKAIEKFLGE